MTISPNFSWSRLWAVVAKEFRQMLRDRFTFAMLIGIPMLQLILFGYAINVNPRHLPTAVVSGDYSTLTRSFIASLENSRYFRIINASSSEQQASTLMQQGKALFIIHIPSNFSHDVYAGNKPNILVTADASDPVATANALNAIQVLAKQALTNDLQHTDSALIPKAQAFSVITHAKYNPELITQYNIVPGLLGVVLTMTMVMITALAITRERERGTMESLLATPARPLEIMAGKIIPFIVIGYIQVAIILLFATLLFQVPFAGSLLMFVIATLAFVAANLSLGLVFSTVAQNQLQAMQMTFFFFLPSILLSGFMFPFYGMPEWAQFLGNILPLTHFLRIVRGVMLKDISPGIVWHDTWPILIFMLIVLTLGVFRFKQRLD